jgi:uncharacterized protein with ATP-grasp and redox domains
MARFSLLADSHYTPCPTGDMVRDEPFGAYWLGYFETHFETIVTLAREEYGAERMADIQACRDEFVAELHALAKQPDLYGELNLLVLDMVRQQKLHAWDIPDPFLKTKQRENVAMLRLYPALIKQLEAIAAPRELLLLLVEGIFAGNIFDLGASASVKLFAGTAPTFNAVRDGLNGKRPWLVDQFDAFADRVLNGGGYRKILLFLDNAGSDCVLGILPFARFMARRGTTVLLAANRLPALNDMTYRELKSVMDEVGAIDPTFAALCQSGKIAAVDSGGVAPLIDLRHVSDAVNAAAEGADLVILEGMGRSLESNFDATFRVDAVKVCMIKEPIIAERHGGKVFDVVFRFDPATH